MTSKILLVDDEERILDVLSQMLREIGWEVGTASRPDEALRLVKEERFQMAFVDNLLGPVEGLALMQQMGTIDPELPFVIMTGNPNIDLAILSLKQGASDFLRKPFRIEDLMVSIDHVNRKKDIEQQRRELMRTLECSVQEKTEALNQTYLSVLISLTRAVEKRDLGTYGHSTRVSDLSGRTAAKLGCSVREIDDVTAASLLHDIGKIGISDRILAKAGPLTDEETQLIRSHPENGVEILQPLQQFRHLLPTILHHHECYDGSGYPAGLAGDGIPLPARIIAVADAYDAILSDRPYRSAASPADAVRELRDGSGRQFDPAVVEAFLAAMEASNGTGWPGSREDAQASGAVQVPAG